VSGAEDVLELDQRPAEGPAFPERFAGECLHLPVVAERELAQQVQRLLPHFARRILAEEVRDREVEGLPVIGGPPAGLPPVEHLEPLPDPFGPGRPESFHQVLHL
jgi:hypothetical protein